MAASRKTRNPDDVAPCIPNDVDPVSHKGEAASLGIQGEG